MAMRNVERSSELLAHLLGRQPRAGSRPGAASRSDAGAGQAASPTPAGREAAATDRVTLSDQARRLERLQADLDAARRVYETLPDSRPERVDAARARLESGALGSDDVRNEVAGRVGAVIRKLEDLID